MLELPPLLEKGRGGILWFQLEEHCCQSLGVIEDDQKQQRPKQADRLQSVPLKPIHIPPPTHA